MAVRYDLMTRLMERCAQLVGDPEVSSVVKRVYEDRLKAPAEAFLEAQSALRKAEGDFIKESREAKEALDALDQPYRLTRAVVLAYLPDEVVPDTLKALPTDTDRIGAINTLLEILTEHESEEWATEQLASDFGTQATQAVTEVNEALAATKAYADARDARAKASGLAWDRYLAFKSVVRSAYGSKSLFYRRIHVRGGSRTTAEGDPTPPTEGEPTP